MVFIEDNYLQEMSPFVMNFYHFGNIEDFMQKTQSIVLVENKIELFLPLTINKLLEYENEIPENFNVINKLSLVGSVNVNY